MRRSLLLVAAMSAAALALPSSAPAEPVHSRSAADFRDSVGVVTHIVYYDTAYGDWPRVVKKLDELGVDHLRDGVYGNPDWGDWNERYYRAVELAAAHGKRFAFGMGEPNSGAGTLDQLIAVVRGRLLHAAAALEGPNEYDLFHGGPNWPTELRNYQQALYRKAKAEPLLRSLPVIGPSLVHQDSRDKLGNLEGALDFGNLHPYSGGQAPSAANLRDEFALAARVSGRKSLFATEVGYHNALSAYNDQPPVPEAVAASYVLRTYLEHFRAGVCRTYLYELIDEKPEPAGRDQEQHFGLLRSDFSEKPAFVALKHMLGLLGRPQALSPRAIDLSLGGDTRGVQQMLLQKTDRRYTLVLWQGASEWDTERRTVLPVPARQVQLSLPAEARVAVGRPVRSAKLASLAGARQRTPLSVPADPLFVELEFSRPPPDASLGVQNTGSACPRMPRGLVLRRAGAEARIHTRRSRRRPAWVDFCGPRSGKLLVELRGPRGRASRVLASRKMRIVKGRPVTAVLRWRKGIRLSRLRRSRSLVLRVRYRPRGSRQGVLLARRLRSTALVPRR
jgi:hypothetical protein